MINIENHIEYTPGIKVWWYNDDSELCSGIVRQSTKSQIYVDRGDGVCRAVATWKCWPAKWMAQFMIHGNYLLSAMLVFLVWGVLWMVLEVIIYGERQPRLVDEIISIPVIIALYFMFRFKGERDRLKK